MTKYTKDQTTFFSLVTLLGVLASSPSWAVNDSSLFAPNIDAKVLADFTSKKSPSECAAQIAMAVLHTQNVFPNTVIATPYNAEDGTKSSWSREDMHSASANDFLYEFRYRFDASPQAKSYLGVLEIDFRNNVELTSWGNFKKYNFTTCRLVTNRYSDIFRTTQGVFQILGKEPFVLKSDFSRHERESLITGTDSSALEIWSQGKFRRLTYFPNSKDRSKSVHVIDGSWLNSEKLPQFFDDLTSDDLSASAVVDAISNGNSANLMINGNSLSRIVSQIDGLLRKDRDHSIFHSEIVSGESCETLGKFFNARLDNRERMSDY